MGAAIGNEPTPPGAQLWQLDVPFLFIGPLRRSAALGAAIGASAISISVNGSLVSLGSGSTNSFSTTAGLGLASLHVGAGKRAVTRRVG